MTKSGKLFVVGTPIGNLEDITLRALRVLGEVSVIAAEDTRITVRLTKAHGINTPITGFREQNASRAIPGLLEKLRGGEDVALVTDAGTPSVSDPGVELVGAVHDAGMTVIAVPGPSALASAISVAGFKGEGVRFLGFLPRSGRRRKQRLDGISVEPALVVLYEAPRRLGKTLSDLASVCGERQAAVLRELTKVYEETVRGTLGELARRFTGEVKGEITLVISGIDPEGEEVLTEQRLRALVRAQIKKGQSVKDLSTALARALGVPRKRVYDAAVSELEDKRKVSS
jgi:16S rRNA (cytidine1402-2'-O)-methyltransferase